MVIVRPFILKGTFGFGSNRKGQLGVEGESHDVPVAMPIKGTVGTGSGNTQLTVFTAAR